MVRYCANVRTLSSDNDNIRILFTHNGKLNNQFPGEISLWTDILSRVQHSTTDGSSSVDLLIHCGGVIEIDQILRRRSTELFDLLIRHECSIEIFLSLLNETEELIRAAYREALTSEPMRSIGRKCGNIFVAGKDEAADATSAMMAYIPEHTPTVAADG
eukprot:gene23619-44172_t